MLPSIAQALLAHLRARQSEMVDFLRRLSLLETPSNCPESQGPAFALLAEQLRSAGYRARTLRGKSSGGQLYGVPAQRVRRREAQLLLGHIDTVWPRGTLARMPVRIEHGRLSGPGVHDMKGGLTQAVFALSALRELQLDPPATPVMFVNSDEEIYSPDSTRSIRLLARHVVRTFVLEPPLGPEGRLKTFRKGFGRLTVTIHGKAAHAGLEPERGASAIVELAHVILYLQGLSDAGRGITVNVGVVQGGIQSNVVAPEAHAEVDLRVARREDSLAVERAVANLRPSTAGTRLEISGAINRPPLERTPRNREVYEAARAAAQELGIELDEAAVGGGSDGNTTSAYCATLDGLGAVGDGAHADHEFVYVDRLPERAALLAMLLLSPTAAASSPGTGPPV
jgi:glutamate carboxypeptidase